MDFKSFGIAIDSDEVQETSTSPFRQLITYYRPYRSDFMLMLICFFFQHTYVWFSPIAIGLMIDLVPVQDPDLQKSRFLLYSGILLAMLAWNMPASLLRTKFLSHKEYNRQG